MPLSDEERAQLEALQAKEKEPDPPAGGGRAEHLEVVIDLSDEAAVERGLSLGFLKQADLDDGDGNGNGDGDGDKGKEKKPPAERTPRRKGYFDKDE